MLVYLFTVNHTHQLNILYILDELSTLRYFVDRLLNQCCFENRDWENIPYFYD